MARVNWTPAVGATPAICGRSLRSKQIGASGIPREEVVGINLAVDIADDAEGGGHVSPLS